MSLIATVMGWVMYLFYQIIPSYGICLILFSLVVKLLTMPMTYKMQVNQARQSLLAPKLEKLRKSYANNQQRLQEEQNKLFQAEGINQTAGCLGSILTMVLVLGVYQVVLRPLTYVLRISADQINEAKGLLEQFLTSQDIVVKNLSARPELFILKYMNSNPEIFSSIEGFNEKVVNFNNNFLGFDLAGIPSLHPENGWSVTAFLLVLLPVISAIVQLISTFVTQNHTKKANPAAPQMGSMNLMLYMSPLITIWIGMSVPAGLSFYWLANGAISLITQVMLYRYLSGERLVRINEREKQKQLAKGPTWMQRMMEQSAQMQAEQNGMRPDSNRTRYVDGDDGMSRKERAEYEKKLIEAARKRAALKYGDSETETTESDDL
ncbi:MAG: YidC/Oxa1 family membrane protein insertase [Oscillospiraceae bacterium]|nr:YidC/Oxa1 family membrane protein insertase [Oscillospiraceae bacterium]